MKTNPNDPAFHPQMGTKAGPVSMGLTKRELFAAMVIQGFLVGITSNRSTSNERENIIEAWIMIPSIALAMADALITELNEETS